MRATGLAALRTTVAVNVCAPLLVVLSAPVLAATGVDPFLCDAACSPGAVAVDLRLCKISDADVHALGGCLDTIGRNKIQALDLGENELTTLPGKIFEGLASMTSLRLDTNHLHTLPTEIFEGLDSLLELDLHGNPDLQCVYTGASIIPVCESPAAGNKEVYPAPPSEEGPGDFRGREARNNRSSQAEPVPRRRLLQITRGVLGQAYDVKEHLHEADHQEEADDDENATLAPPWDSAACLSHWGRPELTVTPDPKGYIMLVNGREQLGGNRFLVAEGLYIAKALGRTLVEFPVKHSRIVGFEDSHNGFGMYWDATELCMYNRILDLERFRRMTADGRIPAENFVTVSVDAHTDDIFRLGTFRTEPDVVQYFRDFSHIQVIVMEGMQKSDSRRKALQYLRPNPFYAGVVRTLLREQEDWGTGHFVAVQWRTETSTGNLTECYQQVKVAIEEQRTRLGYGVHQVFINTDLATGTSGTYREGAKSGGAELLEMVRRDYPAALDNKLHSFTSTITDTGTKAIVAGLAAASSEVMLASSLNAKKHRADEDAFRCQKVFSAYIYLIAQWREKVMGTAADGVLRLFPLGNFKQPKMLREREGISETSKDGAL